MRASQLEIDPDIFIEALSPRTKDASALAAVLGSLVSQSPVELKSESSTVSQLDNVIHDLYQIQTAARIHRNALAPINKLPDDLITLIFRCYCTSDDLFFFGRINWHVLVRVCRRWNHLINADGFLWSYLSLSYRGPVSVEKIGILEKIGRSGSWPLHIYHDAVAYPETYVYELLLTPLSHRVASLHLRHVEPSMATAILTMMEEAGLPMLSSLNISRSTSREMEQVFHLSDKYLALPNLRRITLSDVGINMSLMPTRLEELILDNRTTRTARCGTLDFLDALSRLPHLKILKFNRSIFHDFSQDITKSYPPINLPALCLLCIRGCQVTSSVFLRLLIYPPTAKLSVVSYSIIDNAANTASGIIQPLQEHYRHPLRPRIKALKVYIRQTSIHAIFNGYTHPEKKRSLCSIGNQAAVFEIMFFCARFAIQNRICRRLFKGVMRHVEVLDVRGGADGSISVGWWKMAMLSLPALRQVYLSVDSGTCLTFCESVQSLSESHPRSFPWLEVIYASRMTRSSVRTIKEFLDTGEHVHAPELPARCYDGLRDVARLFRERGYPLREFVTDAALEYWPGLDEAREIAKLVGKLVYEKTQVYEDDSEEENCKYARRSSVSATVEAQESIDSPDVKENLRDVDTLHFCALSRSLDGMFTDDVSYLDKKVLIHHDQMS